MEIKSSNILSPTSKPLSNNQAQTTTTSAANDQVSLKTQSPQDEAIAVMQQMAQARVELGNQLITQVLEPAPKEFQEVSQATMAARQEVAQYLASSAEGTDQPSQQSLLTSAFYVLATETKTLAQAAINTENRAEFQEKSGLKADRDNLFNEELGYLIEANIYQGQIAPEQLQNILTGPQPEGEKALSAGAFIDEVRKYVPGETAQQITQIAGQNPLMLAFHDQPELQKRFTNALQQNFAAVTAVNDGCLQYFNVLNAIMQQDMVAQQVLIQAQQN